MHIGIDPSDIFRVAGYTLTLWRYVNISTEWKLKKADIFTDG